MFSGSVDIITEHFSSVNREAVQQVFGERASFYVDSKAHADQEVSGEGPSAVRGPGRKIGTGRGHRHRAHRLDAGAAARDEWWVWTSPVGC